MERDTEDKPTLERGFTELCQPSHLMGEEGESLESAALTPRRPAVAGPEVARLQTNRINALTKRINELGELYGDEIQALNMRIDQLQTQVDAIAESPWLPRSGAGEPILCADLAEPGGDHSGYLLGPFERTDEADKPKHLFDADDRPLRCWKCDTRLVTLSDGPDEYEEGSNIIEIGCPNCCPTPPTDDEDVLHRGLWFTVRQYLVGLRRDNK